MIAYLQKLGAYDEVNKGENKEVPAIIDPDKKTFLCQQLSPESFYKLLTTIYHV